MLLTPSENNCNKGVFKNSSTGKKDIYWRKDINKYSLRIQINGKRKSYGRFDSLEDAITKRDELLPLLHKEFANTN